MSRVVLTSKVIDEPLPPHEQSLLNGLVYSALCTQEIFSILNKVDEWARRDALRLALDWSLTHSLVDDEQG